MTSKSMYRTEVVRGPLMRVSYAQRLFKARAATEGATPKYGATLILPRSDVNGVKMLQKIVLDCLKGEWGDKGVERFKKGLIKNPILAGDGKEAHDKDGSLRAGMGPDVVFIRATATKQPKVVTAAVLPATEEDVPSGYWGYPVLNAFAWHHPQNGDGISFGISMFQVTRKDEILGGGGSADPNDFFDKVAVTTEGTTGEGGAADLFDM